MPFKAMALVAVGAAGAGAAIAVAAVPDSSGVIHACVELDQNGAPLNNPRAPGNLRVIDPSANQSCSTVNVAGGPAPEAPLSWNTVGPVGPQGPPGPQGLDGHVVTISGQTFSIGNGRALTISGQPLVAPLSVNAHGRPVGTLSFGSGPDALPPAEVLSWSVGVSQASASGGGGGAGKSKVHDIQITKTVDTASPLLFKACATGKHIPKATLTLRKAGAQHPYLTITMSDAAISSFQQSNNSSKPTESLSLNFTKIEYHYSPSAK